MHRKSILGIMGGQNQAKVTKGHQVQIFKKCILEPICVEKSILDIETHIQVKVTNGHQVQRYMLSFKRDVEIRLAQGSYYMCIFGLVSFQLITSFWQ